MTRWRALLLLCLLLMLMQGGLYVTVHSTLTIAQAASAAQAAASAAMRSSDAVLQRAGHWIDDFAVRGAEPAAPAPRAGRPAPAREELRDPLPAFASAHELLEGARNHTPGKKDCSTFPRNRILIIHEQHLQSMGCDVRLLRLVKDLLYLNQEVSMLFRGSTPRKMRQPKSKQLAAILKIDGFEEVQLKNGVRPPPGIYEWTNVDRFVKLMELGYFNVVIIFLWFWYAEVTV